MIRCLARWQMLLLDLLLSDFLYVFLFDNLSFKLFLTESSLTILHGHCLAQSSVQKSCVLQCAKNKTIILMLLYC